MKRVLLASMLLLAGTSLARAAAAPPDYTDYQALLTRYVKHVEKRGEAPDTRFDYKQFYVDEGIWTKEHSPTMEKIHAELLAVHPDALAPRDRLAWALNAFNFLVIERASVHLLVPRHNFQRYKSVDDIDGELGGFFDAERGPLDGHPLTLTRLERWYCYGDSTPSQMQRRTKGDPRVMFALCPGFAGGPAIAQKVYRGETLEQQLDEAARNALAQRRIVAAHTALAVSQYISDRLVDFGGEEGLMQFIDKYGTRQLRDVVHKNQLRSITGGVMPLDRSLNLYDAPAQRLPAANTGS